VPPALLCCAIAVACTGGPPAFTPVERELYDAALERWLGRTVQLQSIHERLRLHGAPICGDDVAPVLGLVVTRARELPEPLRRIGAQRLGESEPPVVIAVVDGLPGAAAGIVAGDRVLRVGRRRTLSTRSIYAPPFTREPTFAVRVGRGERTFDVSVENLPGCAYRAELVDSDGFNAYAADRRIVFLNGMLRLLRDDASIAFVMGHELAHHIALRETGLRSRSSAAEVRADYLGAYLAERAGYRLSAQDFGLVRAAYAAPGRLRDASTTHPPYPERAARFEQTLAEIAGMRQRGEPLLPRVAP
jgi:hypothetical protein